MTDSGHIAYVRWHAQLGGYTKPIPELRGDASPIEDLLREAGIEMAPFCLVRIDARESVHQWAESKFDAHETFTGSHYALIARLRRWLTWPGWCARCGIDEFQFSPCLIISTDEPLPVWRCRDAVHEGYWVEGDCVHPLLARWTHRRIMSRDWACLYAVTQWLDEKPERWQQLHEWRPPWRTVGDRTVIAAMPRQGILRTTDPDQVVVVNGDRRHAVDGVAVSDGDVIQLSSGAVTIEGVSKP